MAKGKRRRFILILCEGPTDENALYPIFRAFFHPCQIRFHICHGDPLLTGNEKTDPVAEIKKILRQEMKKYGLKERDIAAVFQLTDTDGAFIPDECVIADETRNKIEYGEDHITTAFPESILARNEKKQRNIEKLLKIRALTETIPFRIYYVSRNIEHALYGKEEHMNDTRKKRLADDFADEFSSDWRHFYNYTVNECGARGRTYEESWRLILSGTESLKRHTNINMLFEEFGYLCYD